MPQYFQCLRHKDNVAEFTVLIHRISQPPLRRHIAPAQLNEVGGADSGVVETEQEIIPYIPFLRATKKSAIQPH